LSVNATKNQIVDAVDVTIANNDVAEFRPYVVVVPQPFGGELCMGVAIKLEVFEVVVKMLRDGERTKWCGILRISTQLV